MTRKNLLTITGAALGLSALACGTSGTQTPGGSSVGVDEGTLEIEAPERLLIAPASTYTLTFRDSVRANAATSRGEFMVTRKNELEVVIETASVEQAELELELQRGDTIETVTVTIDVSEPDAVILDAEERLLLLHDTFTVPFDLRVGEEQLGGIGYAPFEEVEGITQETSLAPAPDPLGPLSPGPEVIEQRVLTVTLGEGTDDFALTPAFDGGDTYEVEVIEAAALDDVRWVRHELLGGEDEMVGPIEGDAIEFSDLGFELLSLQARAGEDGVLDANFSVTVADPERCSVQANIDSDAVDTLDVATGEIFLVAGESSGEDGESSCQLIATVAEREELTGTLTLTPPVGEGS